MELRFILQILQRIGLLSAANVEDLKDMDRALLTWVSNNVSVVDIVAIESSPEPVRIYADWINQFRAAGVVEQVAEPEPNTVPEAVVNDVGAELLDSVPEIDGFSHKVLYNQKVPHSHELVPRSFFGLPIFSTNDPGTSFEHIDRRSMKNILDTLDLNIQEPEILGVTLDPRFDALLFRAILSRLRGAPHDDFELRNELGGITQEGRMYSVEYRSLIDTDKYSENTLRSPQFVEMVDRSCKRISQFRLAYKVEEGKERMARYMPFFSHLQFNITTQKIEFIGTNLIPQLFRDDKTLSLNTRTLNLSNGKLESSLLYYLTSLPRGYVRERRVPLKQPVPIIALLTRCYPDISPAKLEKDYPRIERVKIAMQSLRDKALIAYTMTGRGKKTLFSDVEHYCEMTDPEFSALEALVQRPVKTGNTLKHFLDAQNAPRRSSDEQRLAFGEKLIPSALALIDDSTEESLVDSFRGVVKPKLQLLRKYAEIVGDGRMIDVVDRVMDIRSR